MAKGEPNNPTSLKKAEEHRGSQKRRKETNRKDKQKQQKINNKKNNKAKIDETPEKDYYGDKITIKNDETLRIGFININGIPAT